MTAMPVTDAVLAAINHYKAGNLAKAESTCYSVVALQPQNRDVQRILGAIAVRTGHHLQAVRHLKIAIEQGRHDVEALRLMIAALEALGDHYKAGRFREILAGAEEIERRKDVIVFGDSHSKACFSRILRCRVQWLGPVTMHRVGRDGMAFLDIRRHGVRPTDTTVFVFGEIDVRVHVARQRDERGRPVEAEVDRLARAYVAAVAANRAASPHARTLVAAAIPPSDTLSTAQKYPIYGPLSERVDITRRLNAAVREHAAGAGIGFLDLYTPFAGPDGSLDIKYSDYDHHIHEDLQIIVEDVLVRGL